MTVYLDNFNGADNDLIDGRALPDGASATWVVVQTNGTGAEDQLVISSNQAHNNGAALAAYANDIDDNIRFFVESTLVTVNPPDPPAIVGPMIFIKPVFDHQDIVPILTEAYWGTVEEIGVDWAVRLRAFNAPFAVNYILPSPPVDGDVIGLFYDSPAIRVTYNGDVVITTTVSIAGPAYAGMFFEEDGNDNIETWRCTTFEDIPATVVGSIISLQPIILDLVIPRLEAIIESTEEFVFGTLIGAN